MQVPLHELVDNFCKSEGMSSGREATSMCVGLAGLPPDELLLFIYNTLTAKQQFSSIIMLHSKNEPEAEVFRARGVDAFIQNDDLEAIYCHTVCIALLPQNHPSSLIAYANRSASLFRLKRFSACLMDVNRALQAEPGLSADTKLSLLDRKRNCIAQLKKEKVDRYNREKELSQSTSAQAAREEEGDKTKKESAEKRKDDKCLEEQPTMSRSQKQKMKKQRKLRAKMEEATIDEIDEEMIHPNNEDKFPLPVVPVPNETIPCASVKVNISFSETYGRHLVATDDITPGEILMAERPFASSLFPHFYHAICRYCYVRCEALIPCPKCFLGTYCSESCRSKAFDEFHRVECQIMFTIMNLKVSSDVHLALRLLLIATKQGANLRSMMQHPTYGSPLDTILGPIEGQFLSDDYNNVHNLMDNFHKILPLSKLIKCYEVSVLLFLLKHTTFFGRSENDNAEVDTDHLSDEEKFAGILLLKFTLLSICNSYPIEDMFETVPIRPQEKEFHCFYLLGRALYPLHSLMNHSCDPNVYSTNHKDSVVSYALQPIKKGEQIFACYNWPYTRYDKPFRQEQLRCHYFFDCECNACKNGWFKNIFYPGLFPRRCSNKISEKQLREYERKFNMCMRKDGVMNQEDFDFLVEIISVYHKCVKLPCLTYIDACECFSFFLSKRANFYTVEDDLVLCKLAGLKTNPK